MAFIKLEGCDDNTEFEMDLSDSEMELLKRVAKEANKASKYCCMPRMYVGNSKESLYAMEDAIEDAIEDDKDDDTDDGVVEARCRDCEWYVPYETAPCESGECINPGYSDRNTTVIVSAHRWCFGFTERG